MIDDKSRADLHGQRSSRACMACAAPLRMARLRGDIRRRSPRAWRGKACATLSCCWRPKTSCLVERRQAVWPEGDSARAARGPAHAVPPAKREKKKYQRCSPVFAPGSRRRRAASSERALSPRPCRTRSPSYPEPAICQPPLAHSWMGPPSCRSTSSPNRPCTRQRRRRRRPTRPTTTRSSRSTRSCPRRPSAPPATTCTASSSRPARHHSSSSSPGRLLRKARRPAAPVVAAAAGPRASSSSSSRPSPLRSRASTARPQPARRRPTRRPSTCSAGSACRP